MSTTGGLTQQIFQAMKAGDREAFDRFFERRTPRVLVYIQCNMGRRLRARLEPADILQNLYLKLYRHFASFMRRAQARGIGKTLIRMADHEITEAYRYYFKVDKRTARKEVAAGYLKAEAGEEESPFSWVPSPGPSVSQKVAQEEEYQRILSFLRTLSPLEQYVTVARVIEDLSAQEIADHLGKSRGAVQMMITRAREKLRSLASRGSLKGPEPRL